MILLFSFLVNLVHDQELKGLAQMGADPKRPAWSAGKAVDGTINQENTSNSCAITDIDNKNTSIWWKVWLQRPFNIAYLQIYFQLDGKKTYNRKETR